MVAPWYTLSLIVIRLLRLLAGDTAALYARAVVEVSSQTENDCHRANACLTSFRAVSSIGFTILFRGLNYNASLSRVVCRYRVPMLPLWLVVLSLFRCQLWKSARQALGLITRLWVLIRCSEVPSQGVQVQIHLLSQILSNIQFLRWSPTFITSFLICSVTPVVYCTQRYFNPNNTIVSSVHFHLAVSSS
jgi:hypothetical protein